MYYITLTSFKSALGPIWQKRGEIVSPIALNESKSGGARKLSYPILRKQTERERERERERE